MKEDMYDYLKAAPSGQIDECTAFSAVIFFKSLVGLCFFDICDGENSSMIKSLMPYSKIKPKPKWAFLLYL